MSDDPVQKEIEANQARKRDPEDVGIEENVLVERDQEGTVLGNMTDDVFGGDDDTPDEADHEYSDNTKST
jgi:hypothetical protein